MDEHDLEAEQPQSRNPVDQVRPGGLELLECRIQVLSLERDVVHPRTAPREEAPDRERR